MTDDYAEELLRKKDIFDHVVPKAILRLSRPKSRERMLRIMALRLGHVTGHVVTWQEIASQTFNYNDSTKTVSTIYCLQLYRKGLRLSRRIIDREGSI